MSNFNVKKFLIGAALIAASFIPGLQGLPAIALTFLRTAGIGLVVQGLGKDISSVVDKSQEMTLNRSGTDVSLPVVYGEAKIAASLVDVRVDPANKNTLYAVAAFAHGSQDGSDIQGLTKIWFDDILAFGPDGLNTLAPFRQGGDSVGGEVAGTVGANYSAGTTVFTTAVDTNDPFSIVKAGDTFVITGETGAPVHNVLSRTVSPVTGGQYDDDNPEQYYEYDIVNLTFDPPIAAGGVTTGMVITFTHTPSRFGLLDYAYVTPHLGSSSQVVDGVMHSKFPTEWPTTSKGAGIAYALFTLVWNEACYTGFPAITALVKGARVYDPRDSTWKYSDNPALCIRDYLTSPIYGLGAVSADLDEQSFIDMANYCDDVVVRWSGGPSGKRFTCNGWVATERSPQENILDLLTSCRGVLPFEGGKYRLHIPRVVTPSALKLTPTNIIGNWNFTTPGIKDQYNVVSIQYLDPEQNYQPQSVDWPAPGAANPYLTADNNYLVRVELHLPFTNDRNMAQQIGMTLLKESRTPVGVRVTCTEEALSYRIGDVAPLTHPTPGWVDKQFWVYGMLLNEDSTVALFLVEYISGNYTLDSQAAPPDSAGTTLPNPFSIKEPTSFTLTSSGATLQQSADGTVIPGIKATWVVPTNFANDHVEIQARKQGTTPWSFNARVDPFANQEVIITGPLKEGETWQVQVRTVNTLGTPSAWVTKSVTVVGKTGAPADVTGLTGTFAGGRINVSWDAVSDIDLDEYEVREGGSNWATSTFFGKYKATQFAIQPGSITKRSWTFRVKAVDTSNNYSTNAASLTIADLIPDASVITGGDVVITGRDTNFTVTVDATGALATEFRLYASKTNGFTPGDTNRRDIIQRFDAGPGLVFTFLPPDLSWFGATIYFKIGLKDELTDVLSDGEQFTSQFTGTTPDISVGSARLAAAAVALSKLDDVLANRVSFVDARNVVLNPGLEQGDKYWGGDSNVTHSILTGGAGGVSVSTAFTGQGNNPLPSPWVAEMNNFYGWYPSYNSVGGLANNHNVGRYAGAGLANDQESQVKLVTVAAGFPDWAGPMVRCQAGAASGYLGKAGTVSSKISKIVAGTETVLVSGGPAASSGDTWKLRVTGNFLELFQNGTSVLSYTDAGATFTSGDPGIYAYGIVIELDDFFAQDFSGTAAYTGNKCMEIVATAVNFGTVYNRTDIGEKYIEIPPGCVVRFGCKAKKLSGTQACAMNLNMADKDKADVGSYPGTSGFSGSTWTSYTGEYTPAAGEKYCRVYFSTGNSGTLCTFDVDDVWCYVAMPGVDIIARSISADRIIAGAITANEIAALTITAAQIAASTITAAKMNVSTLAAITADLGAVTAGTIVLNMASSYVRFRDPTLAHGVTAFLPTDVYGSIADYAAGVGGFVIKGLSYATNVAGITLDGVVKDAPTGNTTPILLRGWKKSGTGNVALANGEDLFYVQNANTIVLLQKGDGTISAIRNPSWYPGTHSAAQVMGIGCGYSGSAALDGTVTTAETSMRAPTVYGNTLAVNDEKLFLEIRGYTAGANGNTMLVKVKLGSDVVFSQSIAGDNYFIIDITIDRTGAATQTCNCRLQYNRTGGGTSVSLLTRVGTTRTMSSDNVLDIRGQVNVSGELLLMDSIRLHYERTGQF